MESLKLCRNCTLYANEDTGRYKKHECMYYGITADEREKIGEGQIKLF